MSPSVSVWLLPAAVLLSGCTSFQIDQATQGVNQNYPAQTQQQLRLAKNGDQFRQMRDTAQTLLQHELTQQDAVQLALLNSPALQSMLARHWATAAAMAQSGRISNPLLSLERSHTTSELEISRMLSLGLLDLLSLPYRQGVAEQELRQAQWQLSADVLRQIHQVRMSWVKAVAAQQSLAYARQVLEAASASAELAGRMRAAGNFSQLQAAREQAFSADATAQLAVAEHASVVAREELIRLLGLDQTQQAALRLPAHLPDIPAMPMAADAVASGVSQQRLDIRLAQAAFDAAAKQQGLTQITSLTDIELTLKRHTVFDQSSNSSANKYGSEISVRLPVFDSGNLQRDLMSANTLAASYALEAVLRSAASSLRESYSAYQSSYAVARQYREEILPLRQKMAEQNQLRYNGMLISVFELLADAREQAASVMAAIHAYQQFWLADAALQSELLGLPVASSVVAAPPVISSSAGH